MKYPNPHSPSVFTKQGEGDSMRYRPIYETGYTVKATLRDGTQIIGTVSSYKRVTQDFVTRLDLRIEYQDLEGVTKYICVPDYRTVRLS